MSESQDVGSDVQLHNLRKSVPGCIDAAGTEIVPLDLDGLNDIAFKADKAVGGQGQPDMGSIPESWAMSQAFNGKQPWPAIDVRVDVHVVMYHIHNEPV